MLKEKVILTTLAITKVGQVKHFQVKIPRDAKRVIGIEASASRTAPISTTGGTGGGGGTVGLGGVGGIVGTGGTGGLGTISGIGGGTTFTNPYLLVPVPDVCLGEFRLQSCGKGNIFYSAHLFYSDNNVGQGYFSEGEFEPKEYTHSPKRVEDKVNETGSATLLKGFFRDRQDPTEAPNYTYTVKIYVWYETNTNEA